MQQLQGYLAGSARGKILLKIITRHLSDYCERAGILPEEQSGFQSDRSSIDMMFVVRRLQELARNKRIPLYVLVCFIDLTKAYDSIDRTLLWAVLARFGVPQNMVSVVKSMMACEHACGSMSGVCSGWFAVEQGFRQGCAARAPPVRHLLCGGYKLTYTRFKVDKDTMDALVHHLRKKTGAGGRG